MVDTATVTVVTEPYGHAVIVDAHDDMVEVRVA